MSAGSTEAWLRRAVEQANADPAFNAAAQWFDCWLQLAVGAERFSLKLFMGQVIRLLPGPVPFGAAFTLRGEAAAWRTLAADPKNRFRELLASGALATEGNVFEALRATKAVALLVEALRRTAAPEELSAA